MVFVRHSVSGQTADVPESYLTHPRLGQYFTVVKDEVVEPEEVNEPEEVVEENLDDVINEDIESEVEDAEH